MPHIELLLSAVARSPPVLVIDGSAVGCNCVALMISLVYRQRALPIAWTAAEGRKGHFPEEMHVQLAREVQKVIPENGEVVLLGDREFHGANLRPLISEWC